MPQILYLDSDIVVVNKLAGMICHPVGHYQGDTLITRLQQKFGSDVRLLHRLDMYTSGIVIAALHEKAVKPLYKQFARCSISKQYLALVYGKFDYPHDTIDFPIKSHQQSLVKIKMTTAQDGLACSTKVEVLKRTAGWSLLLLKPISGRKHQLRVHLAAVGHPIIGDRLYSYGGLPFLWEYYLAPHSLWHENFVGHALHACSIKFEHPITKQEILLYASAPKCFHKFTGGESVSLLSDRFGKNDVESTSFI